MSARRNVTSTSGQKRYPAKNASVLSKRPKLDFHDSKAQSSEPRGEFIRINNALSSTSFWEDDDISGEALEKVCLIADQSQVLPEDTRNVMQRCNTPSSKNNEGRGGSGEKDEKELLAEKLKEELRTKEGEVQVLRSQLQQQQENKQAEALHNVKAIEDMKQQYETRLNIITKECDTFKTRLQFQEVEMTSLQERCKQIKTLNTAILKTDGVQADTRRTQAESERVASWKRHEGNALADLLCPQLFSPATEPHITHYYSLTNDPMAGPEAYQWSAVPQQTVFLTDAQSEISSLFSYKELSGNGAKEVAEDVLDKCKAVLKFHTELLTFVSQRQTSDRNECDEKLLEDEAPASVVTIQALLGGAKLHQDESSVEARRALAFMTSLVKTSSCYKEFLGRADLLALLYDLVSTIGHLRRPVRYAGVLVGVVLLLKELIRENKVDAGVLEWVQKIIQEVIFSRPKLDVLREVIVCFQAGCHHVPLMHALCRTDPLQNSAPSAYLYRDTRLCQAWFFTKDSCSLKLLCIQLMGLTCLPGAAALRLDITHHVILWVMRCLSLTPRVPWLSNNDNSQTEMCCDVSKLLVFLLNLSVPELYSANVQENCQLKGLGVVAVIANGAVCLRRLMKDRYEEDKTCQTLKLALGLRRWSYDTRQLSETQVQAVRWVAGVADLYEEPQETHEDTQENLKLMAHLKLSDDILFF